MASVTTENKFAVPANVDEVLQKTAQTYRKQLITMPTRGLAKTLKYMTLRPGIRVAETVGELTGDAEFGPYDETRTADGGIKIKPRTLSVFLGSVDVKFSPNSVYSTIWGANVQAGDALKSVPIALQVLQLLAIKLGKNLNKVVFNAKRVDAGTKSAQLFNGLDTIAATELANSKLSSDLGNLIKIEDILGKSVAINDDNAVDFMQAICESADEELMDEDELFFYCPQQFVNLYNKAYLKKFGSVPYNTGYMHGTVEGFPQVKFAPLSNKKGAPFFQLSTRSNMLIGVNEANNGDSEKVDVGKYSPFQLDYVATKFFGTQYESINKERILFVTNDGTTPLIAQPKPLVSSESLDDNKQQVAADLKAVNAGADGSEDQE